MNIHLPEFMEEQEQAVGETLCMVIEAMLQRQKSWVVVPRDVIVSLWKGAKDAIY